MTSPEFSIDYSVTSCVGSESVIRCAKPRDRQVPVASAAQRMPAIRLSPAGRRLGAPAVRSHSAHGCPIASLDFQVGQPTARVPVTCFCPPTQFLDTSLFGKHVGPPPRLSLHAALTGNPLPNLGRPLPTLWTHRNTTPHEILTRLDTRGSGGACTTVNGRSVAVTGSDDATVRVWDLTTSNPIGEPLPTTQVYVLGITDDILIMAGGQHRRHRPDPTTQNQPLADTRNPHTGTTP
ncbi:hypothetical protein [Actinoplanes subtropicus]|uniref:hypothetical protein n=1 Tax=Actinoplanes subtropicus TaxID=543632 RepID=UPI0012F757C2|nr:hypothetical protein [Actinoplanes subtropicus]